MANSITLCLYLGMPDLASQFQRESSPRRLPNQSADMIFSVSKALAPFMQCNIKWDTPLAEHKI
jgi:hypothetical protein